MTSKQANVMLHHLRRMASPSGANSSDRELLDRFVNRRDEEAFARLVRRHRPMVQGVCLRVLRHWQDSEDAVQATFLVLARKAGSLRERESAAGWLYRVAYHLALKARAAGWRRQRWEHEAAVKAAPNALEDVRLHEAQTLLDEELTNLSDNYRAPILLCCLEGATRDEAARQLGWSLATLKRRLTKGRELLRARLARRGLTLSAALMAPLFAAERGAAASMKSALGDPSARAVALAEGALRAMTMVKLKMMAVLMLAAGVLAAGSSLLTRTARSEAGTEPAEATASQPKLDADHPGRKDPFGDVLPPGARVRLGTVRFRQGSDIYDIRLSANGKAVVAVDGSTVVRRWDVTTGKELPPLQTGGASASAIAQSSDGKLLATGGSKRICLWDASTGKLLRGWDTGYLYTLAFSADGKLLASMNDIGPCLWETATGKEIARLKEKNEPLGLRMAGIYALAFSPDGRWLAWGYGKSVILWDVATRQEVRRLAKHDGPVYGIAFSPDGKLLASSGEDRVIRLWEPATGRLVRQFPVGDDVKRRHFPAPNGKLPGISDVRPLRPPVTRLLFTADGQTLLSGSGDPRSWEPGEPRALRLWEVATGKEIASLGEHGRGAWALALAQGGSRLISVDGCSLRVWDLAARQEVRRWEAHQDWIESLAYSPDGKRVATGGGDCTVRLWDAGTGRPLRTFPRVYDAVKSVAFSSDGRTLAAGCRDGFVFLWDAATGREVWRMNEGGEVWVTFSPDGKQLIAAGQVTVALRDAATGAEARRINLFGKLPDRIYRVAVSPDCRLLASGDMGCWSLNQVGPQHPPVRLWDLTTGRLVRVLEGPPGTKAEHGATIRSLAFSPDGKILAANDDWTTRLWDVTTGKPLGQFKGGGPSAIFSPDGRTLATGSYENEAPLGMSRSCQKCHAPSLPLAPGCDKRVRLWEVATGKQRAVLQGHRGFVYALAYSPDGRTLASGSGDATGLLWDTMPPANRPVDVEKSWRALADADAAKAYRAMTELAAIPERAVPFLRERVHSVQPVDPQRLAHLLAELDSERFEVREKAAKQIESIGELAKPALHKVLADKPSLEVRRRIEDLLPKLEPANSPEQLRVLRAIEMLEHLDTPAARRVLETLAQGADGARLTHEANASLARLARRSKP